MYFCILNATANLKEVQDIVKHMPQFTKCDFEKIRRRNHEFGDEEVEFVLRMLRFNPACRLTCKELIQDEYLRVIEEVSTKKGKDDL